MLNRARFHETAAQQIRKQLQLLKAELPLPPENDSSLAFMAAAGFGSHVLEDDQDDDGDQLSMSFSCTLTYAGVKCQGCMCWGSNLHWSIAQAAILMCDFAVSCKQHLVSTLWPLPQ